MGRLGGFGARLADESKSLNIFWLKKAGYLSGSSIGTITWKLGHQEIVSCVIAIHVFPPDRFIRLTFKVEQPSSKKDQTTDYKIKITTTPCYFGGVRYWFVCPLIHDGIACNRRVAILYLPSGASYFGCRHCYNLTYKTQQRHGCRLYSTFSKYFDLCDKTKDLQEQVGNRLWYAGEMTRKAKRLMKLRRKQLASDSLLDNWDCLH